MYNHMPEPKRRPRLTTEEWNREKNRYAAWIVAAGVGLIVLGSLFGGNDEEVSCGSTKQITVESGESYGSLANEYDSDQNVSDTDMIAELKKLNNTDSNSLIAGSQITVPAEADSCHYVSSSN